MRQVRLLIVGLLMGGLLGALGVWVGPGSTPKGDPLIAGTRQICEAIVKNDPQRWAQVQRRYFAKEKATAAARNGAAEPDLLRVARLQSLLFKPDSAIVSLRRAAEGEAGDRRLVAVECRLRTRAGMRTITVHWSRRRGEPWRPTDLTARVRPNAEGENPGDQAY